MLEPEIWWEIMLEGRFQFAAFAAQVATLFALVAGHPALGAEHEFEVRFSTAVHSKPFSGRVYIFFSERNLEPRRGPNWFRPELFVARDVINWKPGDPLVFSNDLSGEIHAYPKPFAEMSISGYRAQAVARFNPYEREVGTGEGNGYSPAVSLPDATRPSSGPRVSLTIDRAVEKKPFPEEKFYRLLRVRSKKLSAFHKRDVFLQAAVSLPASYFREPKRRYPVIFTIPGFGGTHRQRLHPSPAQEINARGVEFLRVMLDPSCPLGHHVFADSDNNGPYGAALVEELLPELDRQYRSIAEPGARFLTGHSSGGWSSLWVQITHPEIFGGTWSTAPDPVDFRDFQRINLYEPNENMYLDSNGGTRPLARRGEEVVLTYRGFADMEWVLGPGGQLHSFEAVFSQRHADGAPRLLWDRDTGAIDADVAKTWERYDIRLVLERNWNSLGPKLAGKIHVHMGSNDTFYLEGATKLLKASLEKLGSDAVVEIHPGKDHGSLLSPTLVRQIENEMAGKFLEAFPDNGKAK